MQKCVRTHTKNVFSVFKLKKHAGEIPEDVKGIEVLHHGLNEIC